MPIKRNLAILPVVRRRCARCREWRRREGKPAIVSASATRKNAGMDTLGCAREREGRSDALMRRVLPLRPSCGKMAAVIEADSHYGVRVGGLIFPAQPIPSCRRRWSCPHILHRRIARRSALRCQRALRAAWSEGRIRFGSYRMGGNRIRRGRCYMGGTGSGAGVVTWEEQDLARPRRALWPSGAYDNKKLGGLFKSRLPSVGGISRTRTYDPHDVNVVL